MPVDGLPTPIGEAVRSIAGSPMNPVRRARPGDFIETGISAIDAMNTLVRGQKLPIFSGPGLPGLEIAAQIVEGARAPRGEPFAVVFVAVGITARETQAFLERFQRSEAMERTILYLNEASHPAVERLLAPRLGLTAAEYLAFDARDARARRDRRHDALLRGAARDRDGARGDPRAPRLPGLHVHRPRVDLRARGRHRGEDRIDHADPDRHDAG